MVEGERRVWLAEGPLELGFWSGEVSSRLPGIFRAGLAGLLLGDALLALPELDALYGPDGLWPAALAGGLLASASSTWLHVSWAVGCLALLALSLGWFTRLATVLSWAFLVCVHQRNPGITTAGDFFAQNLLFFMMFLDTGAAFSLDARLRGKARRWIAAAPWRGMQLQLALLYLMTAVCKIKGGWLSGHGIYLSLQHIGFLRPPGALLMQSPRLCQFSTWLVLGQEGLFAFLAFCPLHNRQTRLLAAGVGLLVQLGVLLTMRVGVFTPIMLWVNLLFFPHDARPSAATLRRTRTLLSGAAVALVLLLASGLLAGKRWPWRAQLEQPLAALGLTQPYDLFGRTWEVAEWHARGVLPDGRSVDVLPVAAPGMLPPLGWRFDALYKLTFATNTDYALVAQWLCRAYRDSTGDPLASLELWKHARAPVLPGETRAFADVTLHEGHCPAPERTDARH